MPSPLKSPEWLTAWTVTTNDVDAGRLPSLTVTVIVAVPIVLAVSVSVRLAPPLDTTRPASGTTA